MLTVFWCVIPGCVFLQGGGCFSEQDFHCQSKGGAGTGTCQNQHFLVSYMLCVFLDLHPCNLTLDTCFLNSWFGAVKIVNMSLSYGRLCEVVDHVFPVLLRDDGADFPCTDTFNQCNYWSKQLPDGTSQEEEDLQHLETSWENPAKSSWSPHRGQTPHCGQWFCDSLWILQLRLGVKMLHFINWFQKKLIQELCGETTKTLDMIHALQVL